MDCLLLRNRYGDQTKLCIVINNFLSNGLFSTARSFSACKFTPVGGQISLTKDICYELPVDLQEQLLNKTSEKHYSSSLMGIQPLQFVRNISPLSDSRTSLVLYDGSGDSRDQFLSAGKWIQIKVSDTGIGILKEDLSSLFVP